MLTIFSDDGGGKSGRFCDGISRRSFLTVGAAGFGGALGALTLPELLRAEERAGIQNSHKAVINVFLPGGPPHQDMFDLKPDAPKEIRGEFNPIKTSVPGIEICEHFPRLAKMMDRFAIIRSIVGATGDHYSFQCYTGRSHRQQPQGGWPSMGAVLSKMYGQVSSDMPAFVGLAPPMGHTPWADPGPSGFLGPAHTPFKPSGDGQKDMTLQNGITLDRLADRRRLLTAFDTFRRDVDASRLMEGRDSAYQQAFGVLTSGRLAEALDLSREPIRVRDRYGYGVDKNRDDGGPRTLHQFLLARRLVEAGARCVTLAFSRWDWHGGNFSQGREDMPALDQAITALVEDLHMRGMDKDVSVVVWGEFGRTPQINKDAGRDHWPQVSCALLACGGMRTGQVIGSTDKHAGEAKSRPVRFSEVVATLYHNLGLDASVTTLPDLTGRPQHIIDGGCMPMPELV